MCLIEALKDDQDEEMQIFNGSEFWPSRPRCWKDHAPVLLRWTLWTAINKEQIYHKDGLNKNSLVIAFTKIELIVFSFPVYCVFFLMLWMLHDLSFFAIFADLDWSQGFKLCQSYCFCSSVTVDRAFEVSAQELIQRQTAMLAKFRHLQMEDSMVCTPAYMQSWCVCWSKTCEDPPICCSCVRTGIRHAHTCMKKISVHTGTLTHA